MHQRTHVIWPTQQQINGTTTIVLLKESLSTKSFDAFSRNAQQQLRQIHLGVLVAPQVGHQSAQVPKLSRHTEGDVSMIVEDNHAFHEQVVTFISIIVCIDRDTSLGELIREHLQNTSALWGRCARRVDGTVVVLFQWINDGRGSYSGHGAISIILLCLMAFKF